MSNPVQEMAKLQVVSACFSKLALSKKYQEQWRTNEQWASLLWAHYQDVISPILGEDELSGKLLDAALKKDKVIKNNLQNYNVGTNAIGIMCHDFKPTITLNGTQRRQIVKCYIMLPPFAAEPGLQPGQSWWQTLPPTRTRESNRNKRTRQSSESDIPDEQIPMNLPEPVVSQMGCHVTQTEFSSDPWDDKRTQKLFLPCENEHPRDAIA